MTAPGAAGDRGRPPVSRAATAVDADGRITAWSNDARALLGHDPADVLGRPVRQLLVDRPPSWVLRRWARGEAWQSGCRARTREGGTVDLRVHAQPLTGDTGTMWIVTACAEASGSLGPAAKTGGWAAAPQSADRRRLSVVSEAGLRIGSTLDLTRTAEELAEVAVDHLADFVTVDLLDGVLHGDEVEAASPPDRLMFRRTALRSVLGDSPEAVIPIGGLHGYPEDSPPGRALGTGRIYRHSVDEPTLAWWTEGSPERARAAKRFGIHSVMLVPLLARGVPLGMSFFCRHRNQEPFGDDDELLAEELASRAALCVDNARRYTRERVTAVTLQRSLLPGHTPRQTALDVASRYLPARSRAGVGGDWYDVIPLSGGRVALVVGDVVGHGLRASARMGQLRTAVRTLADVDLPPDELLTQLDDVVIRLVQEESEREGGERGPVAVEMAATCLYAVYDPIGRRCSMASAGHLPPALVAPDGTVTFPDLPVGPPLGVGGLPFETTAIPLPVNSLLVLHTDGLIGGHRVDVDDARAVMREVLEQPTVSLDATGDALLNAMATGRPSDDIALLLARARSYPSDRVATWDLAGDPAVVAEARQRASETLAAWDLAEDSFTTELIVSELVTNAIRYGIDPIRLRLIRDSVLTCEVSDGSNTAPHLRRARESDEGGRGLLLVAQLSDRWGTRQTRNGKTIWTEQALTAVPL